MSEHKPVRTPAEEQARANEAARLVRHGDELNQRATAALHSLCGAGRLISPFGAGMMVEDRGWEVRVASVRPGRPGSRFDGPAIILAERPPGLRRPPGRWVAEVSGMPPFIVRLDDPLTVDATLRWLEAQMPLYLSIRPCPVAPWPYHRVTAYSYDGALLWHTVPDSSPPAGSVGLDRATAVVWALELLVDLASRQQW